MTELESSVGACVMVAIDVAKLNHEVLIEFPDGKRKKLKISNNVKGFNTLYDLIKFYPKIIAGLEPSGNYHRNLGYFLIKNNIDLKCISSITASRTREALHNSWDKNDPKDAQVILYLLKNNLTQIYHEPFVEGITEYQELAGVHHQVSLRRTKIRHSILNHFFTLYFPEVEKFWNPNRGKWFPNLILRFPVPDSIKHLSEEEFLEKAMPILKGRPSKESLLRDFYMTAKESVGIPISQNSQTVKMFQDNIIELQKLVERLDAIEEIAHTLLSEKLEYKILRSIPGIGPILALNILAEAGDLNRFKHEKQYLKFCGFNLSTSQSGQYRSKSQISKRGNRLLRSTYWQAARIAIQQKDNSFKEKFARYIAKDPQNKDLKRKAYTATAIKMARVSYALYIKKNYYRPLFNEVGQVE